MTTTAEYAFTIDEKGVALQWQGQTLEIEAADLRQGDWIPRAEAVDYCGCDPNKGFDLGYQEALGESEAPMRVMERWHNDHHAGAFRFCYEEPCRELRGDTHS